MPNKTFDDIGTISVTELSEELNLPNKPQVIDVREAHEVAFVAFPNAMSIPLGLLPQCYTDLDEQKKWVVLCHHGYRSMQATIFLKSKGFVDVRNITGGIDAWATAIDTTVARY